MDALDYFFISIIIIMLMVVLSMAMKNMRYKEDRKNIEHYKVLVDFYREKANEENKQLQKILANKEKK